MRPTSWLSTLVWSGAPSRTIVAATTIDFLRWTLTGDAEALEALRRDGRVGGVATLDDRL